MWWEWDSAQQPPAVADPGPVFAPAGSTRIMPVGDSITLGQGWTAGGGWRATLWGLLRSDGRDITPVGGMSVPAPAGWQAEGGWRIRDQGGWGVRNLFGFNAVDAARFCRPRVMLVHLGTNDVGDGVSAAQLDDYIADYRLLLDSLYAFVPAAHVFIARIVLQENGWSGTRTYNDRVQGMVEAYAAKGRPYRLVTGMEGMPAGSWADGLHPNEQGYRYMAGVWHAALTAAAG